MNKNFQDLTENVKFKGRV